VTTKTSTKVIGIDRWKATHVREMLAASVAKVKREQSKKEVSGAAS
jgi:hypothetical protein